MWTVLCVQKFPDVRLYPRERLNMDWLHHWTDDNTTQCEWGNDVSDWEVIEGILIPSHLRIHHYSSVSRNRNVGWDRIEMSQGEIVVNDYVWKEERGEVVVGQFLCTPQKIFGKTVFSLV